MATHISQIDAVDGGRTILRIEGEMKLDDALLLEKITEELRSVTGTLIAIDLADLALLDSEAARIIKRLQDSGVMIEGVESFLQATINQSERSRD